MLDKNSVCIIGAGSCGIAAAKVFYERGIPFDCYEKGSGIGGNWRYKNDNGMSSAYRTLHINTSKTRMSYSDYPMPNDYPDYPHHSQILDYFENYVDHFGFRDKIQFCTGVEKVEPASDGGYHVTLSDGRTLLYRAVVVANGHHWNPRLPTPPFLGAETFTGVQMHSHDYKEPEQFIGQNVLVVGIGNSGVDIACDTARVSKNTYLSTRRGAHIIPKYVLGIPTDLVTNTPVVWLPLSIQRLLLRIVVFMGRGSQKKYGVPMPEHPILAEHPTVSSDLLNYVGHGKVKIKGNIECINGDTVQFVDGTEAPVDAIIYATGYNVCFPFFDPKFIQVQENALPLYQQVIHPENPGLFFLGLLQPLGAIMPLAEMQSEWIACILQEECVLPSVQEMHAAILRRRNRSAKRYVQSARHTMQVDYQPYLTGVVNEIKRGKRRAVKDKQTI